MPIGGIGSNSLIQSRTQGLKLTKMHIIKVCRVTSPALIFLAAVVVPFKVVAQKALPVANIAGRQINLELVKSEDLSPITWPDEDITLIVEDVEVKDGDTITKLLEARGIIPDNESYTLFYDLNPQLDNLEQLAPHSKYKLPKVVGGQMLARRLSENCLVLLTLDKALKDELKSRSKAVISLAQRFSKIGNLHFNNPQTSTSAKRYVKELAGWYDHIYKTIAQRTAKPIRRVSLVQIVNEAEALTRLLSRVVKSNRKLHPAPSRNRRRVKPTHKIRPADYAQIVLIHQDIEAIIDRWDEKMAGDLPRAEAQYKVEVVIKGKDSRAIKNLRVYYVMNGYYRSPPTNPPVSSSFFPRLGERVSETLPMHNFKIWVARDGEPGNQLIKPVLIYVDKNMTVELSLQ